MAGRLWAINNFGEHMGQIKSSKVEREAFAREYVTNGERLRLAWERTFPNASKHPPSQRSASCAFKKLPEVAAEISRVREQLRAEAQVEFNFAVEDVLRHWITLARADPAEVIQHRRGACRHCHGFDNEYQWENAAEFKKAKRANKDADDFGGYGYRHTDRPADDCPVCEGEGLPYVWVADTRDLSPSGRLLYDGLKQTPHGVSLVTRNRDAALENLAKYFGMFTENLNVNNPDGNLTPTVIVRKIIDPRADE